MEKLPKTWVQTTLGEVAEWGSGGTPNRAMPKYFSGTIPWIKTGELNNNLITKTEEYLSEEALKNSSAKIFSKGSIAIAMYGATIGKTAILGIDAATNQACAVARAFKGVNNKYLYYYLTSEKQNFIDKGKGGAQPNISQTVIKAHPFPLPPLNEQERIANRLYRLFEHIDVIQKKMEAIPEFIRQFKQSILLEAVTGRLTENWRKKNKKDSKWKKVKVSDFMFEVKDKTDPRCISETNYIGLEHIEKNGELISKGSSKDVRSTKTAFKTGDVLYGKLRPYLNKHIIAPFDGICSTDILVYRHEQLEYNKFFDYFLGLPDTIAKANSLAKGINLPRITATEINNFNLYMPPIDECKEIVTQVEILMGIVSNIEQSYSSLKMNQDALPVTILNKAFKGELEPQLEDDGDAADLLKMIKEQRDGVLKESVRKSSEKLKSNTIKLQKAHKSASYLSKTK